MVSEVSIIMPAYNAQEYISSTIKSVQSQSFSNWELIIVDDGSTDATSEIIKDFESKDSRIKCFFQENKKQAAARNKGIIEAKGEWIAFLDADDIWLSNKLEEQRKTISNINADVYYAQGYIIDEDDNIISKYEPECGYFNGREMYKRLYKHNPIPILSVIFKKKWVSKVGDQNEDLRLVGCEDWDYWLRLAKAGASFYGIEGKLFKYRIHSRGTSMNELQMKMAGCCALLDNYDPTRFNALEIQEVKSRFVSLIRSIIPALYVNRNKEDIIFFLSVIFNVTGFFKFRIADFFFYVLGYKSKRLVKFLLFH